MHTPTLRCRATHDGNPHVVQAARRPKWSAVRSCAAYQRPFHFRPCSRNPLARVSHRRRRGRTGPLAPAYWEPFRGRSVRRDDRPREHRHVDRPGADVEFADLSLVKFRAHPGSSRRAHVTVSVTRNPFRDLRASGTIVGEPVDQSQRTIKNNQWSLWFMACLSCRPGKLLSRQERPAYGAVSLTAPRVTSVLRKPPRW